MISIHTPLAGSDAAFRMRLASSTVFQSTLLAGSDETRMGVQQSRNISIHTPCGERRLILPSRVLVSIFQSTLPLRGATSTIGSGVSGLVQFQSTLPLRGATWSVPCRPSSWCNFNPHSPCGERQKIPHRPLRLHYFNPHSPCGERPTGWGAYRIRHEFQSTLPCGERRGEHERQAGIFQFQSTLLAGSDRARTDRWSRQRISIHTPLRGATSGLIRARNADGISIHTPCGERRAVYRQTAPKPTEFQSTLLAGSDSPSQDSISDQREFQSTLLAGSDIAALRNADFQVISIHTPCGERPMPAAGRSPRFLFQSTLPCGERRPARSRRTSAAGNSIHTPCGEPTCRSKAYQRT